MKMPDKQAIQRQLAEEAKARVAAQKAHRRAQALPTRAAPTRTERLRILIVCQGQETETSYFKQFQYVSAVIETVPVAQDPVSLVEAALLLRDQAKDARKPYDHAWCVFDKDDSPADQFNAAVSKARSQKLRVAYSNQAFEFWLLLHFEDHQGGGLHRKQCTEKLLSYLPAGIGFEGSKKKRIGRTFFDILQSNDPQTGRNRRKVAIGRARTIAQRWQQAGTPPADQESATLVYELVMQLQQHL